MWLFNLMLMCFQLNRTSFGKALSFFNMTGSENQLEKPGNASVLKAVEGAD